MNRQEDFRHILSLVLHVPSSAINQYSTEVAREVIIRVLFCLDVSRRYQSLEFETRRRALWFPITRYSFVSKKSKWCYTFLALQCDKQTAHSVYDCAQGMSSLLYSFPSDMF